MAVSAELRAQLSRIAPVVLAAEQILPVPDVFDALLPGGGLQRGWTLQVSGDSSARALAWGLLGGVTTAGGWIAAVNVPGISLAAAQEVGVAIERVLVVSSPAESWAATIGALIGAVDVVVRREDSIFAHFGVPDVRDQLVVLAVLTLVIWVLESAFEYWQAILWRNLAQQLEHDLSDVTAAGPADRVGSGHGRARGAARYRAADRGGGGRSGSAGA